MRIRFAVAILPLLSVLACAPTISGQAAESQVEATLTRLFDAMRTADGNAAAAIFHPEARLQSVSVQDGEPTLQTIPGSAFVEAIGTPRTQIWNERTWDLEIRVDGNLATAWMQDAFFLDDTFSHCGVNAVQLFRGDSGWQIIHVTDTRRTSPCSPPAD